MVAWVSARLPLGFSRALGRMFGRIAAAGSTRLRAVTELNVALCLPELPPDERRRLVQRSLMETGATASEMGALWGRSPEDLAQLVASVEGGELLDSAVRAGNGVILLLPHLGNWELFNPILTQRGRFFALYRSARIEQIDRMIRESRERTGCRMAPATSGGVRLLLRALRDGETVAILPDQEPVEAAGAFGRFFGVPALTMTLVRGLLRRTGATALYGFALRGPSGRFEVNYLTAPEGLDDENVEVALTRLNYGVERCIRLCPEQYQWSYKRFKSRPEGELTPYRSRSFEPENIGFVDPVILERLGYCAAGSVTLGKKPREE
jgi:KDO2-lipid IV(A) lauroyltransferase